jgi:hypothetical protein
MKTNTLFLLGLAVGLACLILPPDAHGQMSNNRLEFVTQASASAYDAEFGGDVPPDLILVLRTNAFTLLQTNVNLALNAAVTGASADSQAAAFASIQPLGVTLTGSLAVATTTATNRLNSAQATAGQRFDLLFDLPCTHEASLRTFLEGSVSPGSLLGQIRLDNGPETVLWRLLPGDSGRATNRFTLGPSSYRLLVEFNVGTSATSGSGGGGAAAFSRQLDLAPVIPTLEFGEDLIRSAVIDAVNGYGWFGGSTNQQGRVIRLIFDTLKRCIPDCQRLAKTQNGLGTTLSVSPVFRSCFIP